MTFRPLTPETGVQVPVGLPINSIVYKNQLSPYTPGHKSGHKMPSELLSLGVFSYCLDLLEFDHPSRSLQTFLKRSPCFFQSEAADITRRRIRICMSQDRLNDRQRVSFLIQDRRRQMPDAVEPEGFDFGPATEILHQMLPMEKGLPVILPAKVGFL